MLSFVAESERFDKVSEFHGGSVATAGRRAFRPGERSWITSEEGRTLFSSMDDEYAFGELDEPGKLNLGAFAAANRTDFRPLRGTHLFHSTRKLTTYRRAGAAPHFEFFVNEQFCSDRGQCTERITSPKASSHQDAPAPNNVGVK
jgi:hypothetical protein